MTHNELVREIAKKTRLPVSTVGLVLRGFIDVTRTSLLSGREVRLYGFGVFSARIAAPKILFGGRRKTTKRPIVRFRETRYGQIWLGPEEGESLVQGKVQAAEAGGKVSSVRDT